MTLIKPNTKLVTPEKDVDEPLVPKGAKQVEEYLKLLPKPVGYRLLVRPYQPKEKTKGGLYLTEKTLETQQLTTVVGMVVKMGDLCYKDKEKMQECQWGVERYLQELNFEQLVTAVMHVDGYSPGNLVR